MGASAGLFVFLALYTLCALFNAKLGYQGNESRIVSDLVWREWRGTVLLQVAKLILAYGTLGALLGALVGWGLSPFQWSRRRMFWVTAAVCLAVELLLLAADAARHPHLYATTFWNAGPARGALLLFTQRIDPTLLSVLALGVLLGSLGANLRSRHLAAVLGLLCLSGTTHLDANHESSERAALPNLVILAADGLRPDRITPRTAPHLSRFLDRSTRFSEALVDIPRTAPSWTTLLTSQPPALHGVRHSLVPEAVRQQPRTTLATALRAAGYSTAVVADYAGDHFTRFDYGFDAVDAPAFTFPELIRQRMLVTHVALLPWTALVPSLFPERRQLPELTDPRPLLESALERLPSGPRQRNPFALVVFASTTHFPYAAPHPHANRFTAPDYRGPWRFGATPRLEASPPRSADDIAALQANYDAGVHAFDALAGALLDELNRRGLTQSTVVTLLSDHGEHLGERDHGQGHGEHLWGDEALRMSWAISWPGRIPVGAEVKQRVRSLDVAPTLLELLGVSRPTRFRGRSVLPLIWHGDGALPDLPAFHETDLWFSDRDGGRYQSVRKPYPWIYETAKVEPSGELSLAPGWEESVVRAKHRGVSLGRWKLLELPTARGVRHALYDVEADPENLFDLADRHPERVEALSTLLGASFSAIRCEDTRPLLP